MEPTTKKLNVRITKSIALLKVKQLRLVLFDTVFIEFQKASCTAVGV